MSYYNKRFDMKKMKDLTKWRPEKWETGNSTVGTSCMGAYYVLNTYYVLYFTYNTLHTYRAKQD